ncbi:MAG: hypothetical protein Q7T82_07255 [Armatimonadota bacterium]|nr:hypothetical protein [Armatimonadota bacterium]
MKKNIPLHAPLFIAYPILFLYAKNVGEARFSDAAQCFVFLMTLSALLYFPLRRLLRNGARAGVLVTYGVMMFFAYGSLFDLASTYSAGGVELGKNRIVFPIWTFLVVVGMVGLWKVHWDWRRASGFLTVAGLTLVSVQMIQIGMGCLKLTHDEGRKWSAVSAAAVDGRFQWQGNGPKPDIYYIILDSYARGDALKRYYRYSDEGFLKHLRQKGFYVATESRANYLQTYPSLACSLNMDYLGVFAKAVGAKSVNMRLLGRMIKDSKVGRLLKAAGYKYVFFPSGYQATDRNSNADITFSQGAINLGEFERALIKVSALRAFDFAAPVHRKRVRYTFDSLERIPDIREPTFTFAHIVCPHSPYVFDSSGATPDQPFLMRGKARKNYVRLYVGQLDYISKRTQQVIDTILARSDVPPIIIIQADHGPEFKDDLPAPADIEPPLRQATEVMYKADIRTGILNAYYFQGSRPNALYDSISPVNSFRMLFNERFGMKFERLPDCSYVTCSTPTEHVYSFTRIFPRHLKGDVRFSPSGASRLSAGTNLPALDEE